MRTSVSEHIPNSSQSDWWKTGVVYQIYPRSFGDSNGDGIGDLPGILEHLDHLRDGSSGSLGIDAIWLSPVFPSPDFDFGYDVADYLAVDPRYGTIADFDLLVEECHRRGLRVILDLVLNHSSHEHPWFLASRADRAGPFGNWYIWRDSPGRSLLGRPRRPNNWRSWFGGPAWTWDEGRGQFYLHTFLPEQPDLNWRNPAVRQALLDVVRAWLDRGVDGFRLDVFNVYFKDGSLRSNPRRIGGRAAWSWQRHVYDRNQAEMDALLEELRAIVDERPGRMTVGELFDGAIREAVKYAAPRHLIFDWAFIRPPWSAAAFRRAIADREAVFGPERWPANVLSNHDQPRHASRFDGRGGSRGSRGAGAIGDARAKVAAAMLLTLRGTAFLYYAEEIAQRDIVVPNAEAFDPPARRSSFLFPWWNRDQARGPMAWRPGPGAGFTTGTPWLPLPPDADVRNVQKESSEPESVLNVYRRLLRLRAAAPVLNSGGQELLDVGHGDVLAYVRHLGATWTAEAAGTPDAAAGGSPGESPDALVLLNFASRPASVRVPVARSGRPWRARLSTHPRPVAEILTAPLTLEPLEALIAFDG
jgi:alpha-glucosidase